MITPRHHLFFLVVPLLAAGLAVSSGAVGQTARPASSAGAEEAAADPDSMAAMSKIIEIETRPNSATPVPETEPIALDMTFIEVPDIPKALTDGVTANAHARHVIVEDRMIGQLVLGAVSKKDRVETLNTENFVSQFDLEAAELPSDAEVIIEGDHAELLAALKRLNEEEDNDTEKDSADYDSESSTAGYRVGSNVSENQDAAGYTPPSHTPGDREIAEAPRISVDVTTEGCDIRVDLGQLVAIQQTRVVTKEGDKTTATPCEDGNDRYRLQRSYAVCPDDVQMDRRQAVAQYQLFYVDGGGTRHEAAPCQPDADKTYAIVENLDACPVSIDQAAAQAVPQATLVYVNDTNAEIEVRGCAPSETAAPIPLERVYERCPDVVDVEGRVATAQYELYFADTDGGRTLASQCQPDPKITFPIVEDTRTCTLSLDYDAMQAVPQATLSYTNGKDETVEVRGCGPSVETPPVPLVPTIEGCTIRHAFAEDLSYQQGRLRYTLEGSTFDVGDCADNGTTYPHQRAFTDAGGRRVCEPIVDERGGLVTNQYRTRIVVDGVSTYITPCSPDAATVPIHTTRDGCEDPATWTHDVSAGISYENVRAYYMRNGQREYLTDCKVGTRTYRHGVSTAGWQMNDGSLYGVPLSKVTINSPGGTYVVAEAQVLPGAVRQPYIAQGTTTEPTGQTSYSGCQAHRATRQIGLYERPDGSVFEKPQGAGPPLPAENVCGTEHGEQRQFVVSVALTCEPHEVSTGGHCDGSDCTTTRYRPAFQRIVRTARKIIEKNRETGQIISEHVAWADSKSTEASPFKTLDYNTVDIIYADSTYTVVYPDHWGGRTCPDAGVEPTHQLTHPPSW